ncbi:hypothetical protein C2845_PM14G18530 [Panicum miliaceum]|uniref:BPM/SPOP BACK domain-containing protein n=1 Tax=Panicum miliaceum TaxID=4540 RepID=A0A3L6PRN7_PANMI|nr:hypothetical protein C2845_PM14G18530 [Panicum miliaceum]
MLRFMYTDALPEDLDGCSPSGDLLHGLLAAADRYALDALKTVAAQRLGDAVSVDNMAAILSCAEAYGCPELKIRCLDFFMEEENFRKVVLTRGYLTLSLSLVDSSTTSGRGSRIGKGAFPRRRRRRRTRMDGDLPPLLCST